MSADGHGPHNEPQYSASGAPADAADLTEVAAYAAKVGNLKGGTTADMNALTGADRWEGLYFSSTTDGILYRSTGSAWAPRDSDWIVWTPTISAGAGTFSVGNGTLTARYRWQGGRILWMFRLVLGSTSSIGTNSSFTLPVNAESTFSAYAIVGRGTLGVTNGSAVVDGVAYRSAASQAVVIIGTWNVANTYPGVTGVTAAIPFGWGAGCYIELSGSYDPA